MFIPSCKRTASPAYPLQTSPQQPFWLWFQLMLHNGCTVSCLPATRIYIYSQCSSNNERHDGSSWGIAKYKAIFLKIYNDILNLCQGRAESGRGCENNRWRCGAQKRGAAGASMGSELLVCVFRFSGAPGWHESEKCHHSQWFNTLWALGCLQVTASALYSILGYMDISLSKLCLSLSVWERGCVYFCVLLDLGLVTLWSNEEDIWPRGCRSHVSNIYALALVDSFPFICFCEISAPTSQLICTFRALGIHSKGNTMCFMWNKNRREQKIKNHWF